MNDHGRNQRASAVYLLNRRGEQLFSQRISLMDAIFRTCTDRQPERRYIGVVDAGKVALRQQPGTRRLNWDKCRPAAEMSSVRTRRQRRSFKKVGKVAGGISCTRQMRRNTSGGPTERAGNCVATRQQAVEGRVWTACCDWIAPRRGGSASATLRRRRRRLLTAQGAADAADVHASGHGRLTAADRRSTTTAAADTASVAELGQDEG